MVYTRALAALIVLLLSTGNASAELKKTETFAECNARLKSPLRCYCANAPFLLTYCQVNILLSQHHAEFGLPDTSCIGQARDVLGPYYEGALRSAKTQRVKELLKDAHAYWLTSISAMVPDLNETKISYELRTKRRIEGMTDLANRLKLEQPE